MKRYYSKSEKEYWKSQAEKQKLLRLELEKREIKRKEHQEVVEYCKRICEEYKRSLIAYSSVYGNTESTVEILKSVEANIPDDLKEKYNDFDCTYIWCYNDVYKYYK